MADLITKGCLFKAKKGGFEDSFVVQVSGLSQSNGKRYKCTVSDGEDSMPAALGSQISEFVERSELRDGSIVKVLQHVVNNTVGLVMMITELEVVGQSALVLKDESNKSPNTPQIKGNKPGFEVTNQLSGKENKVGTPGPTPSPSEAPKGRVIALTPPVTPSGQTQTYTTIEGLHPYSQEWRLKAKLVRKYPMRTIKNDIRLFTVELLDDTGKLIQGTFWRDAAEKYNDTLTEGKVYVFNRFSVKPANRAYSSVNCEYEMHLDNRTDISEPSDQGMAATMVATVELVPIPKLVNHIGKKAPVDVLGILVTLGSIGSVKRKNDAAELTRREVTIADQSGQSVNVTLWADHATNASNTLEGKEGSVVQITSCRVSDFSGCSLSTLMRSAITLDPSGPEAEALQEWWQREGKSTTLTPCGSSVSGERAASGSRNNALSLISSLSTPAGASLPSPDAKPEWCNIIATVAMISTEQTMYYLANPENGRKVVEQGGRFYSEADQKVVDRAENRYVMSLKAVDSSGDVYLNLFNTEAQMVLGLKADALAEKKGTAAYASTLKAAQWGEWAMTIMTKTREYNGERRARHTVSSIKPVDYVADTARLMELISRFPGRA